MSATPPTIEQIKSNMRSTWMAGDFGVIVFNLVEAELMSKTPEDSLADFENRFDLDAALVQAFRLELPSDALGAELSS